MSGSGDNIRQRKDGRWEGRYYVNGRLRSVYGPTMKETQTRLRAALTDASVGIRPSSGRLTTADYLEEWLESNVKPQRRTTTYRSYADTVHRLIVPRIGRVPIVKLEARHIQRMLGELAKPGKLSPTTVRYAYTVLRIALGRAVKQGIVPRNVATLVDPPQKARPEITPMSADEVKTFIASLAGDPDKDVRPDPLEALYVLAITTGLRQGELLALRWQDIDMERGVLTVRHSLMRTSYELGEPKTRSGRRSVHLGASTMAALRRHRVAQREMKLANRRRWQEHDYAFTTAVGSPLDHRNAIRSFAAALRRAGLPPYRFHDMRHTSATLGLANGESLYEVSRRLGHANISTTADIYGHVTPEMQERSAERMDAVLSG